MAVLFLKFSALSLLLFILYVRFSSVNIEKWHLDPLEVKDVSLKSGFLYLPKDGDEISKVFNIPSEILIDKLTKVLASNSKLLTGDLTNEYATYVSRSLFFGFPDYSSIRVIDLEDDKSQLAIYARLRFGNSDFGVNKRRVLKWLDDISILIP